MNRAYRYRIYPDREQQILFAKTFGCCRFIYNRMLSDKISWYEKHHEMLRTTPAQYKKEFEWLKEVDSLALSNVQLHLESAYRKFFREKNAGFPKYKSKRHHKQSYTTNVVNGNIRIEGKRLRLPKVGMVKIVLHRQMPKEAKLKNIAPIKYQIEISNKYWESIFKSEGITDRREQQKRIVKEKQQILDFLTGVENAGKVWFSTFYVAPTGEVQHEVVINKIDNDKEGGDWSTDIQEAVNMFCFTMRVHSNLVGSVPGKSQTNNSGSDKRELYTIAHSLQKPYHDLLFAVHRLVMRFNGWKGAFPECPFVQLTLLSDNVDAQEVTMENDNDKDGKPSADEVWRHK